MEMPHIPLYPLDDNVNCVCFPTLLILNIYLIIHRTNASEVTFLEAKLVNYPYVN